MIKGSIQKEDVTTAKVHVPNAKATGYLEQVLMDLKGDTNSNTTVMETLINGHIY